MNVLQERFKKELERISFEFKTQLLDLPHECDMNNLKLDQESLEQVESTMASMGQDLDNIFDVLNDASMSKTGKQSVVIEHKWNVHSQSFE